MKRGILFAAVFAAFALTFVGGRSTAVAEPKPMFRPNAAASAELAMINMAFEGGPLNGQHMNMSPFTLWLTFAEGGVVYNEYYYVAKFPNFTNALIYQGDLIGGGE